MFLACTGHAAWSYSDCDGTYRHITVSDCELQHVQSTCVWEMHCCLTFHCYRCNVCISFLVLKNNSKNNTYLLLIVFFWIIWEALGWSKAIGLQEVWHISTLRSRGSKGITKLSKTWVPSSWGTSRRRSHLWAFFKCLDESKVKFWCGWLSLNAQLVPVYFPNTGRSWCTYVIN